MTTWSAAAGGSTTYGRPADIDSRYIAIAYIENDYIASESVWSSPTDPATSWA
jgi:hypothetical protein